MIMTMPVRVRPRPAHLVPELGKRGSYSATYGPHPKRVPKRGLRDGKTAGQMASECGSYDPRRCLRVKLSLIVGATLTSALSRGCSC